jgi:hypothetical protein
VKRNRLGACSSGQCSLQASICFAALFCNVVARTFIIGGDNEERENQALVRSIIPSVMVNCHCLAFSGFGPTATRLRFCFLLLVAEGIDVFAKGSVNFTIGKLIDELEAF